MGLQRGVSEKEKTGAGPSFRRGGAVFVLFFIILLMGLTLPTYIYAQQLRLTKVIPLTNGKLSNEEYFSPQWSPDGKKIAVTKRRNKGIYLLNTDGKISKTITEDDAAGFRFVWSPDGKEIVYRSKKLKDGLLRYKLKSTQIETGETIDLTEEMEWISLPAYSITKGIMHTQHGKLKQQLMILPAQPGKAVDVADNVYANAVVEIPLRNELIIEDDEGIKIMDSSGRNRKTIIKHGKKDFAFDVKVSQDSKLIMFFNNVGSIGHLYVYDLDIEKITDLGEGYFGQWLPDNRILFYIAANDGYVQTSSDLYIINADGTGKMKITDTTDQIEIQHSVSPDGKSIVYLDDKSGKIYLGILEEIKRLP